MLVLEQKIQVFKIVAESRSITQASKKLHMSQPCVSIQMHDLEREFECILFTRSNQGIKLTIAGHLLYKHVNLILKNFEKLRKEITDLNRRMPNGESVRTSVK